MKFQSFLAKILHFRAPRAPGDPPGGPPTPPENFEKMQNFGKILMFSKNYEFLESSRTKLPKSMGSHLKNLLKKFFSPGFHRGHPIDILFQGPHHFLFQGPHHHTPSPHIISSAPPAPHPPGKEFHGFHCKRMFWGGRGRKRILWPHTPPSPVGGDSYARVKHGSIPAG